MVLVPRRLLEELACVEELEDRPAGVLLDVSRWTMAAARNSGRFAAPSPSQSLFCIVSCKFSGVSVTAAILANMLVLVDVDVFRPLAVRWQ